MTTRRATILVVDDDAAVRGVLRDALRMGDFDVLLAEGGEQALALAEQHPLDLVVLDLGMPGMSGYELLDGLRERRPGLPVVILSGLATPEETPELMERGARAIVGKPFGARDFLKVVESALEPRSGGDHSRT